MGYIAAILLQHLIVGAVWVLGVRPVNCGRCCCKLEKAAVGEGFRWAVKISN